ARPGRPPPCQRRAAPRRPGPVATGGPGVGGRVGRGGGRGPVRIEVASGKGSYPVEVGAGNLRTLGAALRTSGVEGRVAVVTDRHVEPLWAGPVIDSLASTGYDPVVLAVEPGEGSKSLAAADALWGRLIEGGFGRSDTVVALGGGVVGDLAGFVAATFHRGMGL